MRTKSVKTIDEKICAQEAKVARIQKSLDEANDVLLSLYKEKDEMLKARIFEDFKNSGKTYEELKVFLNPRR